MKTLGAGAINIYPPDTNQQEKPDYEAFAANTYATMHWAINHAMNKGGDRSILTIIGEGHNTNLYTQGKDGVSEDMQEPFVAAAFAEVSALEASKRLFGADNTVLSVELDADTLADVMEDLKNQDYVLDSSDIEVTMLHAISYAHKNGIEIVPNDFPSDMYETEAQRDLMMIDAIAAISREDERKSVIHIGGAAHLSNMSGYTDEEIENAGGDLKLDLRETPFSDMYEQTIYVNAARFPQGYDLTYFEPQIVAEASYMTDPENAIQIDAPGRIDFTTLNSVADMVNKAAQDHEARLAQRDNPEGTLDNNDPDPPLLKRGF